MLTYRYQKDDADFSKSTGEVNYKHRHQLAGRSFNQIELKGTLDIRNVPDLVAFHSWLQNVQGCIQQGKVRATEPTGTWLVKYRAASEYAEVSIDATLKCGQDCHDLAVAVEKELRECAALPEFRISGETSTVPASLRPLGNNQLPPWAGSKRGLGEALHQAVCLPAQACVCFTDNIVSMEESVDIGRESLTRGMRNGQTLEQARQEVQQTTDRYTGPGRSITLTLPADINQRPMVQHALRELRLAGYYDNLVGYGEDLIAESVLDLIRLVSSQGHSGGSFDVMLPLFDRLVRRKPLTPLTDDPAEWTDMKECGGSDDMRYQNNRDSSAFSSDGGKTYWTLAMREANIPAGKTRDSKHVEPTGPHPVGVK